MHVGIIGTGHIGLVAGACLAKLGNEVMCADRDETKIESLKRGTVTIYEPGLQDLVTDVTAQGRLRFTTSIAEAVEHSEVVFICVGTPAKKDGSADLGQVEAAAREVATSLSDYRVIVEKSTVPARTGERIARTLKLHARPGALFDVVSFPEFSREGSGIDDFLYPDRIILGVESPRAEAVMRRLLGPISAPLMVTDRNSAEMIKHASNCFLAMKISYVNAVANVCERVGADVLKVAEGMGLDRRIQRDFLDAGIGFGGSCFPKDLAAFIAMAEEAGYDFGLLKEVRAVNDERKRRLVANLRDALWVLRGKTIAVWGLAFKPNTDDVREAPAFEVIEMLLGEGCTVRVYDPEAMPNARAALGDRVVYCRDAYDAAQGADAVALVTEWDEFKALDMAAVKELLTLPIVVDGRNALDRDALEAMGFQYYGLGRAATAEQTPRELRVA
ncbi:MAG: UDP-glucose/GDP-mannose dehydrogenase family protein [Chloroflexi bacterium]|nr:UDP-glucose/GDP-mannose dehydrogenase family protein [Chloroflexota bacterium]